MVSFHGTVANLQLLHTTSNQSAATIDLLNLPLAHHTSIARGLARCHHPHPQALESENAPRRPSDRSHPHTTHLAKSLSKFLPRDRRSILLLSVTTSRHLREPGRVNQSKLMVLHLKLRMKRLRKIAQTQRKRLSRPNATQLRKSG